MNQTQYRQAAIELGKIPGMERSPWVLQQQGSVDAELSIQLSRGHMVPARLKLGWSWGGAVSDWTYLVGPWLNIDDFSDWSAAKIRKRIIESVGAYPIYEIDEALRPLDVELNLFVVLWIIESYKINSAAVIAALPEEKQ